MLDRWICGRQPPLLADDPRCRIRRDAVGSERTSCGGSADTAFENNRQLAGCRAQTHEMKRTLLRQEAVYLLSNHRQIKPRRQTLGARLS